MTAVISKYIISIFLILSSFSCNLFNNENEQIEQNCELINSQNQETCEVTTQYDYCLEDINPSSCSYGEAIGRSIYNNQVTVHYFGHQS